MTDRQVLELFHLRRDRSAGHGIQDLCARKRIQMLDSILSLKRSRNRRRKLVGAGCGDNDRHLVVPGLQAVVAQRLAGHGGMRIHEIFILSEDVTDFFGGFPVIRAACSKHGFHPFPALIADRIAAALLELLHPDLDQLAVTVSRLKQQALQVGGDQNVHGRTHGLVEHAVHGINAGGKELGQHIVPVACTDQLIDRETHVPGIIAGQNVPEVAGGHNKIDALTGGDGACCQQIRIGAEVIHDLRHKPSEIDAVCGGQDTAHAVHILCKRAGGKQRFHAGLCIVKVSPDGNDMGVVSVGSRHLKLLHFTDAVERIEDRAAGARHISESFQCSLACVAAGRNQDCDLTVFPVHPCGAGHQLGKQLKRHVFKGQGRPVEEFKHVGFVIQPPDRRDLWIMEMSIAVCSMDAVPDFLRRIILKIDREHTECAFLVAHGDHLLDIFHGDSREHGRHIQSAVFRHTGQNGLGSSDAFISSRRKIGHGLPSR